MAKASRRLNSGTHRSRYRIRFLPGTQHSHRRIHRPNPQTKSGLYRERLRGTRLQNGTRE